MGPEELREMAKLVGDSLVSEARLLAAAAAWEADIKDARVYERMANRNADVIAALRQRLAEAEKVRDDFSYISGWTINTADVPTPYLLWQALRAALATP